MVEKIKNAWGFWLVLSLALLFYSVRGAVVTVDSTFYIVPAINISQGLGYLNADWTPVTMRGPVFPAILAFGFKILGPSIESAMYMVRLFFVGNLLVLYWLGKQFGGRSVGIVAAILALTSYTVHIWSARIHLDHIMPFFILLSNLLLLFAISKKRLIYYIIAGSVLGLGFLVKDVAGLFVALPALLWIVWKPYRQKKNILPIVAYVAAFFAFSLPWLAYAVIYGENNYFVTLAGWVFTAGVQPTASVSPSTVGAVVPDATSIPLYLSIPATIAERFIAYYEIYFAEHFSLAPAFIIAWLYVIYRAIRYRRLTEVYLLLLILLFAPIMLFLAKKEFRAGQTVYTYLLSYLVLAYALVQIPIPFQRVVNYRPIIVAAVFFAQLLLEPSAFISLLRNHDSYGFVKQASVYTFSFLQPGKFETRGSDTQAIRDAGEWLRDNVEENEVILADGQWLDSHYFYTKGLQPIYPIEYASSQLQQNVDLNMRFSPRFIWTQAARTNPSEALSHLWAFSEPNFLSQVDRLNVKYVVLGVRRNFLALYLHSHPDFVQVAEFDGGRLQVFMVIPNTELKQLDNFPLFASNRLKPYLKNLRAQRGLVNYTLFNREYFRKELLISETKLHQLEAGMVPTFSHISIISHKQYASIIKQTDLSLLLQVIQIFEEQATDIPDNPWIQLSLAHLYHATGQPDKTRFAFVNVIALAEQNPLIYPALLTAYKDLQTILIVDSTIPEQFINSLKRFIAQSPNDIQAYWQLAKLYQWFEEWDSAIATYNEALSLWPQSAGTMLRIAKLYQSQTQYENAQSAYAALLTLPPDDPNLPDAADIHIEIGQMLFAQERGVIQ